MNIRKLMLLAVVVALLVLLSASAAFAGHLADGLVGYWPFDDTLDPTADLAHGNDGSLVGSAAFQSGTDFAPVPGNSNSMSVDGSGARVEVPDAAVLNPADAVTVSAWIKPAVWPQAGYTHLVFKGANSPFNVQYLLAYDPSGKKARFLVADGPGVGATFYQAVGTTDLSDTSHWYHLAGTYDKTTGTARIYVDGSLEGTGSGPAGHTISGSLAGAEDLGIGSNANDGIATWAFDGLIDEVRIYDGALSADEIDALADFSNFDISLAPDADINPVGATHTATATLDPSLSFIPVLFEVTGANSTSGSDLTGDGLDDDGDGVVSEATGEATFDYTGANAGVDTITACIDLDDDGACEPGDGEPTDTAAKYWLENFVTGGGKINADSSKKAEWTFGGTVGVDEILGIVGQFQIVYHGDHVVACHFDTFTSLVFSSTATTSPPASNDEATFAATGDCNDATSRSIQVSIHDVGEPGKDNDTISWTWTVDGLPNLEPGTTLDGGNLQVHDIDS